MFRHVVLLRWVTGATDAERASVGAALGELPGLISAIRAYHFGPDAEVADGNFDYAVVADFDDTAGYVAYRDHPAHQTVVSGCIAPILAERTAVQYEFDD